MDRDEQRSPTADNETDTDEDIIADWIDHQAAASPQSRKDTRPVAPAASEQPDQ